MYLGITVLCPHFQIEGIKEGHEWMRTVNKNSPSLQKNKYQVPQTFQMSCVKVISLSQEEFLLFSPNYYHELMWLKEN